VADRRSILGLLALPLVMRPVSSEANTMSTLLDLPNPTSWTPPNVIPSDEVLDLTIQQLRQQVQLKAQLDVSDAVQETSDIISLSRRMMLAGDRRYCDHVAALPKAESRLHWLAWTLEARVDAGLAYLLLRIDTPMRERLLAALAEAGVVGRAAAVREMLPLLPAEATDYSAIPEERRKTLESVAVKAGGPAAGRQAIRDHLESDADAQAFIATARQALDDETRVYFLFRSMIDHFDRDRTVAGQLAALNTLPIPHRVVWLVHVYRSELHNGGIEQNFSNSGGVFAPETAAALRLLGLDAHGAVMEQGIALFPKPFPRDRNSPAWPADISDKLYPLGDHLNGEDVDPALAAYARREGVLPR
jgi:hypothetical protein